MSILERVKVTFTISKSQSVKNIETRMPFVKWLRKILRVLNALHNFVESKVMNKY